MKFVTKKPDDGPIYVVTLERSQRFWTEKEWLQVVEWNQAGLTAKQIGELLGRSMQSVSQKIHREGYTFTAKRYEVALSKRLLIIALMEKGMGRFRIARATGINVATVGNVLWRYRKSVAHEKANAV